MGANGPARVLVDGVEVGRQGGFDPYAEIDKDRLQPYELAEFLPAGEHELRLELLDLGRARPTALLDGLVQTAAGAVPLRSGEAWKVWRDGSEVALDIRLDQHGDPAYNHAWRRPHPLPDGAWLEPGRRYRRGRRRRHARPRRRRPAAARPRSAGRARAVAPARPRLPRHGR